MAENVGKRVGRRVRDLRKKAGLSQAKLAERLGSGVAVETVSRFERGAQIPTFEWVERIASALGTDLACFLAPLTAPTIERERIADLLAPLPDVQLPHVYALLRAYVDGVNAAREACLPVDIADADGADGAREGAEGGGG